MRSCVELLADTSALLEPPLDAAGAPVEPVLLLDLQDAGKLSADDLKQLAEAVDAAHQVTVGVAEKRPPTAAGTLLRALTLTLLPTGADDAKATVRVPDPYAAAAELVASAAAAPRATVALNQVLRQTTLLGVRAGLAAESAAYSTLLAGPEFATWLAGRGPARTVDGNAERVRLTRDGDMMRIELARPERRNAVDAATRDALCDALLVTLRETTLQAELSGLGPDFCGGGDLDEFGTTPDAATAHMIRTARSPAWLMHLCRDRLVARVHGACVGAGVELPAFAGRVVAAPDSWFALPELAMGLIPGAGGTVSVPRRIGRWRTAWLVLNGARLDVPTAMRWGLVDEVAT